MKKVEDTETTQNEQLNMEHLTPYLSFKLQIYGGSMVSELVGIKHNNQLEEDFHLAVYDGTTYHMNCSSLEHSPILKPLRDYQDHDSIAMQNLKLELIEEMELSHFALGRVELGMVRHRIIQIMNKNHIDYNDLIGKGLAVDQNTLK